MSRKLLENAATVIACSTVWDTAQTIDTLPLSGRIHIPSDIMLFTFSAQNTTVITTAKESALQAWAKKTSDYRYSVRHLQQVEELIRVGCNYICSTTVTVNVSHCLCCRMSFMDQE